MNYKNFNRAAETMVSPVSDDSNPKIVSVNAFPKRRDPLQEEDGLSHANVSLSEKAHELKMFESDSPLTEVLKKEFNEVFEFNGDKRDSFLKKLDHIFANNRL